jgi:hypothetical protein
LACYAINPDGCDGCRVAFSSREYSVGPNGDRFGSTLVRLVDDYTSDHENRTAHWHFHHNCGYVLGEVIVFSNVNNNN